LREKVNGIAKAKTKKAISLTWTLKEWENVSKNSVNSKPLTHV